MKKHKKYCKLASEYMELKAKMAEVKKKLVELEQDQKFYSRPQGGYNISDK